MKRRYVPVILLALPLTLGAGIPNFFSGLIGKNVKKYCDKPATEQEELIHSVNLYTGDHKVVVVCGEKLAEAEARSEPARSHRIAR